MNGLSSRLAKHIRETGPMTFAQFMEEALYAPDGGYYEAASNVIGRSGDFYTSTSVGSLFGEMLAFEFAHWLEMIPSDLVQLVEAGAHGGQLAEDILKHLRQTQPKLFHRLQFCILEPSPKRREWQRTRLAGFSGRVQWHDNWQSLPTKGIRGIIFSNEFLDAIPVRRLGWDKPAQRWFEWGVGVKEDRFRWEKLPALPQDQTSRDFAETGLEFPDELLAVLPDRFTIELAPQITAWWRQAANALHEGVLLAIDYGMTAAESVSPDRLNGTLRAYRRHSVCSDVLADPGRQDLTASVNFTPLQRAGESIGLRTEALCTQAQFLTRIAECIWKQEAQTGPWDAARTAQFKTLTHPEHLGRPFRVLIQSRRWRHASNA